MSRTLVASLAAAALIALTLPAAHANPGSTTFSWSFQTTSLSNVPPDAQIALTMRNGQAWPLAIAVGSSPASAYPATAATLFPAGPDPLTNWSNVGSNFFPTPFVSRLRAASSPASDGRVAFAASDQGGNPLGGRVSLPTGGWSPLPSSTKAVAFDANGNLYTASPFSVSGTAPYSGSSPIVDLAVSRATGDVAVLSADLHYWNYSAWTNSWSSATLSNLPVLNPDTADLEFDSLGRPHVVATFNDSLVAYDFDTVTGHWSAPAILATGVNPSTRLALAANADNTVGTAYLDFAGRLIYVYKHDTDPWLTSVVSTSSFVIPGGQVGIAYDYANLPVLAYASSFPNQTVTVAYDPVVIPEPTAFALLALAALLPMTRRRLRA